jgi:hypothetical protein
MASCWLRKLRTKLSYPTPILKCTSLHIPLPPCVAIGVSFVGVRIRFRNPFASPPAILSSCIL